VTATRDGARLTSDILVREPGSVFTAGDNAYGDGTAANFADCYDPTWGRVKDRTLLPAAGNHDWDTGRRRRLPGLFREAPHTDGPTWYSTDLGNWHIVVLDSDCAKVGGCDTCVGGGASGWRRTSPGAMRAARSRSVHHPRFSSGQHGDDPTVAPFWNALHAEGAELVVNGPRPRLRAICAAGPRAASRSALAGIRELVVGTGGAELRSFPKRASNSEFRPGRKCTRCCA